MQPLLTWKGLGVAVLLTVLGVVVALSGGHHLGGTLIGAALGIHAAGLFSRWFLDIPEVER